MYCLISISQLTLLIIPLSLQIGSDRSFKLTEICRQRGFQAFVADVLSVPLRSESFDVCICIAVIHHLSTEVCHWFSEYKRDCKLSSQGFLYYDKIGTWFYLHFTEVCQ